MIDYKYRDLFKKNGTKKDLFLDFGDFQITNNRLYSEAFELSESLCSQNELRFGYCEASVLKFKCRNEFGELKDKWFDASMVIDGNADEPFKIGSYRVFESSPSGDRLYTNITAYDAMYGVINAEMVDWYDHLAYPVTLKYFRTSFFAYLGLKQVDIELVNDDMLIEKTIDADSISGKQIITAICELNGVFGHINRQGLFDYVTLAKRKQMIHPGMKNVYPGSGIYPSMMTDNFDGSLCPSEELYPSEDLYPSSDVIRNYDHESVPKNLYTSCEYEDFETKLISKLQIRQEENDIGIVYGDGDNTYIVQDNFLVYGKSSSELETIARKLFTKINGVYYRPFKAKLQGNPCIEVGDIVVVHTTYKDVESYVLERNMKGIQSLQDSFESKGVYEYEEKVNSSHKEIKKLKGKTNKLERTVEMLNSEINDEETGLKSQIKQVSDSVAVSIDENGDVITVLNLDRNGMSFVGNKVVFKSDNFNLDEDGNLSISGRYSVEHSRIYYADDYTESDIARVRNIVEGTTTPDSNDYKKYDFKGTGISAFSYVAVSNLVNRRYEWVKYTYRITIDPETQNELIKTEIIAEYSNGNLSNMGTSRLGGDGISANEAFFDSLEVKTGATGSFTSADGKFVSVESGIITNIS